MALLSFFDDVVQYAFLRHALLVSMTLGIGCGMIGCFIILRGLALMGDAISHAVIPGVAISFMLQIHYFIGAAVFGVLSALLMGVIRDHSKIKSDAAIGIVFSAFLALGILLITQIHSPINLMEILFGNVLTVRAGERYLSYGVVAAVAVTILLFYKELLLTTFDPVMAQASGLPVKRMNYLVIGMLTVITVVSLQTVGAILVVAMLITPASTAYLLTNKLSSMLWLSSALGAIASVVGLIVSVTYNLPSGVMIVLVAAFFFIVAFLFSPQSGLLMHRRTAMATHQEP